MKKWVSYFLKDSRRSSDPETFSAWQIFAVSMIVLFAVFGQLWCVDDPCWLAFETGFQELIARRHIDPGLSVTNGLSTLHNLGPEPTYHATHPPLLQLTIAGLYVLFGESEAVARIIPIFSFWFILWGVWYLSRGLSIHSRICALAAAATIPLSFFVGRIVNFEAPVLACIVMTMVCIESLNSRSSWYGWFGLVLLGICGPLTDWPYSLFVMCLLLISWIRLDRNKNYFKAAGILWIIAMGVSTAYVLSLYGTGVLGNLVQHAKLQSGMMSSSEEFQLPPAMVNWEWWSLLLWRLFRYGSPVFVGVLLLWIVTAVYRVNVRRSLPHWCFVLLVFFVSYIGIFSRASHNHLWCLFYVSPLLCLVFGITVERVKPWVAYSILLAAIVFASPVIWEFRYKTPLRDSVQAGRAIASATECLPENQRSPMEGPLLFVNRVDPLPYYAQCETAFSHLAVKITSPEKFLIRCRPEFVVLSGYKARPSITVLPEYSPDLFQRLNKSYTMTHQQDKMELWESLWSPYLSIMGLIQKDRERIAESKLVDDKDEVHIGIRFEQTESPLVFDLRSVSKPGRRWLHGWVIVNSRPFLDPVSIAVRNEKGEDLGKIQALPQKDRPRWQEFWLPVGDVPERLTLSWAQGTIVFGGLRLMNEILWAADLSRVLASEIQRILGPDSYGVTSILHEQGKRIPLVLQHPGFGVDSVSLPPFRIGLKKDLIVRYGLSPSSYSSSDGVMFRLTVFDHALGRTDVLFEDFIDPEKDSSGQVWRTRTISLDDYSRHVVQFTFEAGPGPDGNRNSDHAMWREIRIAGRL